MRINKYVAIASGMSRRAADKAIEQGRISINGRSASIGDIVGAEDIILLDKNKLETQQSLTIIFNKPPGYVVSRNGQGSPTIYQLLESKYQLLKPVGRLDKDSSGLLLMTNNGELANQLTHPRYAKTKVYEITLDKPLAPLHQQMINDRGIQLGDGISKLSLHKTDDSGLNWQVTMTEGRNRQIRRTFAALGYEVNKLHRIEFGQYKLASLMPGKLKAIHSIDS